MGAGEFYSLEGPLESLPAQRQMRTANLDGFHNYVRVLGGNPKVILERYGLDPGAVCDPDYLMNCQSLVDVLEYCSASFNDSLFGLHLAAGQAPDVFGTVTALCRASPSFRDALESFVEYIPVIHSPLTALELAEGTETAELRWSVRTDLGVNRQANYQAVLLDLKLLRMVGGSAFRPSYVNLAIDVRRKDIPDIEDAIGCKFNGGAATNAIGFPAGFLNQRVASSNRTLFQLLGGYLNRVKEASRTTIFERVEDYVRGSLPSGTCSIERCARNLGISVRTLQANLSAQDIKFSDILERQRLELARTYLERGRMSLDDVALSLGYSEQSSFGRAFKRWTGLTPERYRAAALAKPRGFPKEHALA